MGSLSLYMLRKKTLTI